LSLRDRCGCAVDDAVIGRPRTEETATLAGDLAIEGAQPLQHNAFKVPLLRNLVKRAIRPPVPQLYARHVQQDGLQPAARYEAFLAVLDRDAHATLAAVELVLAQPSISSQLIDNLNASIHLRALLTDLFILDEILKTQPSTPRLA
jgi:hypothetical protein